MVIQEFGCAHFRNYGEVFLRFSEKVNIFVGKNGQGKTNLAEAIYFLSNLDSFRIHKLEKLIQEGQPSTEVKAKIEKKQIQYKSHIELSKQGRKIWLNAEPVKKVSDYVSMFYSTVFNPDNLYLHRHHPHERRAFIDRYISFIDPVYLVEIRAFRSLLQQKNKLLKSGDYSSLADWNKLFAEKSCVIVEKRRKSTKEINDSLPEKVAPLLGQGKNITLSFFPSLKGTPEKILDHLERVKEAEIRAGHSLLGPHRDDFRMESGGRGEDFFSQGEYRISLLSLKFTLSSLLEEKLSFRPIIILDDLFSELDAVTKVNLVQYLNTIPNQVFITTTAKEDGSGFPQAEVMEIEGGKIV